MTDGPLRVGMDAREPLRPQPRGIGQYGSNVLRAMQREADDVEFVLYHQEDLPATPPDFVGPKARTQQVRSKGYRWRTWERIAMPWRLSRDKLSVYHGIYNTLPPRWPGLKCPPMIVSIHDVIVTWYDDDLHDPYVQYCRQATPRFLRQASQVLTVSEYSRRDIAERYDVDPAAITVIHNGVHDAFLQDVAPEAIHAFAERTTGGRPYLYAIGAALERKNTGATIDILGQLARDRDLPHALVISGLAEDDMARFRDRAARAGIADRVHLLGYLDRDELTAAFAGAALFVYPSKAEGWGVPVVEALAVGTPVATSNTTAIPEAGGDDARYFDPEDLDSMVATVREALEKPQWFDARRDAARTRARGFTWANAGKRMIEVYREVAARS